MAISVHVRELLGAFRGSPKRGMKFPKPMSQGSSGPKVMHAK